MTGNLPGQRAWDLLNSVVAAGNEPVTSLLSHPKLTERERAAMRAAETRCCDTFSALGGDIIEYPQFRGAAEPHHFPPCLFVRGNKSILDGPTIAIVGTRTCTPYGKAVAKRFAADLAAAGLTVISGGAFGIDAAAHEGALEAGGHTVAVLPCGADVYYPPSHRPLLDEIAQRGLLVSPFALGAKARDHSFLQRNAVIAALADTLLLVEVPAKSGASVTALHGMEQGKPVFVVPGPITSPSFMGSHALIRDGATLVVHPENILSHYDLGTQALPAKASQLDPDSLAGRIMAVLEGQPITAEAICMRVNADTTDVLMELTTLELEGLVIRDGIGYALGHG